MEVPEYVDQRYADETELYGPAVLPAGHQLQPCRRAGGGHFSFHRSGGSARTAPNTGHAMEKSGATARRERH